MDHLSQRLTGRMAAVLFVAAGLATFSSTLLPGESRVDPLGVTAVSLSAVLLGVACWFMPWERWSRATSLALVPTAFGLIALGNHFAGAEPFRYGIYFAVAFTWIGFSHPRGTSLLFAPLFVVAYLAPLFTTGRADPSALGSLVIAGPTCLVIGEALAWVSHRMRQAEISVRQLRSERYFRALIQNASDVIIVLDGTGHIRFESPSVERLLGRPPEPGRHLALIARANDQVFVRDALDDIYGGRAAEVRLEFRVQTETGDTRLVEAVFQNLLHDATIGGVVINLRDVTERRLLEEQLKRQAFHDALTGLANRALFGDRVDHALRRLERAGRMVAVLFVDLDDFKTVNDSLGHAAGDALLVAVSRRLRSCLRPSDTCARLGGDEFAVLLEDVEPGEAEEVGRRILGTLTEPVKIERRWVTVGASIGISFGQSGRHTAADLLRNADAAMYSAKEGGKGNYEVFRTRMQRAAVRRLHLRTDLERALRRREFVVFYQPIVALATGEVAAVEALVRWQHPRRGLVLPGEFIALAEETGLIVPLGRWVLEQACTTAREVARAAPDRDISMSVNISPRQLNDRRLVEDIARALSFARVPPERLLLEITEGALARRYDSTIDVLREVRRLGVRIAIDDFGTGYSSLGYLRRFPIDVLKIDGSFVAALDGGGDDSALVESILHMGRALRLETVAEGVADERQAAELRAMGGELAQGNHFCAPVPATELPDLLARGPLPNRPGTAGQPAA